MPTATAPLGKPSAPTKPAAGLTKPGLSRQTSAPKDAAADEEEEAAGLQPIHLGISVVALLLAALFLFTAYSADQTPNRVSDYLFGRPDVTDDSGSSAYSSDSDDNGGSSSSTADDDDEEEEDEEED